jgi:hypothetical protein
LAKTTLLGKLLSLDQNPGESLSKDEIRELRVINSVHKLGNGATGAASTYKLPYATSPHDQQLFWAPAKPMNCVQAGRMLNISLRVSSEQFTGQVERIAHAAREETFKKVFTEFDTAFRARNMGGILLAVEKVKSIAAEVLSAAVETAMQYESEFPRTPELAALTAGRTRQKGELNAFFASVTRGASTGAESQPAAEASVYLMGFWAGFFDGLRAGRYCADLTASTLKRGRKTTSDKERSTSNDDSHGASTSDDGDASDARSRRREKARKKERKQKARENARHSVDGGGGSARSPGGGGAQSARLGPLCRKGVHFPSSRTIIGAKLGVKCSANGICRACSKEGHWAGECPVTWARAGQALPGYSENGKRFVDDWDAEKNPKKDCAKLWVKFLKSKKNFPGGGIAALEPKAPTLADYEAWVGAAQ